MHSARSTYPQSKKLRATEYNMSNYATVLPVSAYVFLDVILRHPKSSLLILALQHQSQDIFLLRGMGLTILKNYSMLLDTKRGKARGWGVLLSTYVNITCMSCSYLAFEPRIKGLMIPGRFARRPHSYRKSPIACANGWRPSCRNILV